MYGGDPRIVERSLRETLGCPRRPLHGRHPGHGRRSADRGHRGGSARQASRPSPAARGGDRTTHREAQGPPDPRLRRQRRLRRPLQQASCARDPRRWLPNAYVQAVAYRGNAIRPDTSDSPYQLDATDITGPLDAQIEGACRFVARNMKVAAFKDLGRRDLPRFDMTAVFEAVVNAVAHRDYAIHGAKVRLRLFENRLELHSPGAIPNGMSVENLAYLHRFTAGAVAPRVPRRRQCPRTAGRRVRRTRRSCRGTARMSPARSPAGPMVGGRRAGARSRTAVPPRRWSAARVPAR